MSVARNTKILLLTEAVNASAGVATVILLARALDPSALGLFSFGFAAGAVLSVACLYGSNLLITRETARTPGRAGLFLGASLAGRGAIGLLLLGAAGAVLPLLGYRGERLAVAALLILARLFDNGVVMSCAFFRGFQDMALEARLRLSMSLGTLAAAAAVLLFTPSRPPGPGLRFWRRSGSWRAGSARGRSKVSRGRRRWGS